MYVCMYVHTADRVNEGGEGGGGEEGKGGAKVHEQAGTKIAITSQNVRQHT